MSEEITVRRRGFLRLVGGASILAALPVGSATAGKGRGMKLEKLAMPPFNTTLMGVVKGALDYHKIEVGAPTVFGVSGHAFLINIHKQLCPSGPYCWNRDAANPLLRNLGLEMTDLGFFSPQSAPEDRAAVEKKLRDALDRGIPCSLMNLENQLIAGYDDDGFLTLQPWAPKVDFPPARLTFGSWREFGDRFHVNFYTLRSANPVEHRKAVLDSLDYAVGLHTNPAKHSLNDYGIGPDAYENWINAAAEFGATHGNWWNATVWSECRQMASRYFADIQQGYDGVAQAATELAKTYADIAGALGRLSEKKMEAAEKVKLLAETKEKESEAIRKVAALAASLRSGARG
ncbi:MAG: hypothetical protein NTW86_25965 [Candidatus Sumerlaeota bacterium]|nr:hypothetical protein [Candidatus Sumerlaeota bacterium]